jgi:hypothetical protein
MIRSLTPKYTRPAWDMTIAACLRTRASALQLTGILEPVDVAESGELDFIRVSSLASQIEVGLVGWGRTGSSKSPPHFQLPALAVPLVDVLLVHVENKQIVRAEGPARVVPDYLRRSSGFLDVASKSRSIVVSVEGLDCRPDAHPMAQRDLRAWSYLDNHPSIVAERRSASVARLDRPSKVPPSLVCVGPTR